MEQLRIEGTTFNGIKGKLVAFNNFLLENVKRMYQIEIHNAEIIWAGKAIR